MHGDLMTQFQYTAVNEAGERVSGAMEAESEAAVLRVLEEKRLFPLSVSGKGLAAGKARPPRRRVRTRDLGILYGQLADLIGSGVPLLRALDTLVKSTVHLGLRDLL